MIFKSVRLENFGCIGSFEYEFSNGILVLAGQNGMGKSTVLKAILLAVFDDYQGVLSDYVKWEAKYFKVSVAFFHIGVDYISSVYYDDTSERMLEFKDKVLKGDEAKKKLKEIMDVDLLKAGMLSMEQRIAIVETKPAQRREYLKRIYDIEFKKQLTDIDDEIKTLQIELASKTSLKTQIEGQKYDVPQKPELPFSKSDYDFFCVMLESKRKELLNAQNTVQEKETLLQQMHSLKNEIDTVAASISKIMSRIDVNSKDLESIPQEKIDSIQRENESIAYIEDTLLRLSKETQKRKQKIECELKALVFERLPVFNESEFTSVSQELYVKKTRLNELLQAKDVCPTCGQKISSPEHIAHRKVELEELKSAILELDARFKDLNSIKLKRDSIEISNRAKEKERSQLQHNLEILEHDDIAQKAKLKSDTASIKDRLSRIDEHYQIKIDSIKKVIDSDNENCANQKQHLKDAQCTLEIVKGKLETLPSVDIDALKISVSKLESDVKNYDTTLARIAEIQRMQEQIENMKKQDEKKVQELASLIQTINKTVGDRQEEIKILKTEFPVYVISRVIQDIEKSMNEFLKCTYPKYKIKIQDKRNALHIVYGPKNKDVSCASGFERQIFSLSFMFAVSRAIGNRCMILDEADSSATDKNSQIFYRVLGDSVGRGIDQIILVSHKQSTRDILQFDYNAKILTFENGVAV